MHDPSHSSRASAVLPDLVRAHAQRTPMARAAIDTRGTLSFAELHSSTLAFAAALHRRGVGAGDRVGLWLPNSTFWLQAHLAAAHLGAVTVGINARYPVPEVARIATNADLSVLVVDPASGGVASTATTTELCSLDDVAIRLIVARDDAFSTPDGVDCVGLPVLQAEPLTDFTSLAVPEAPCAVFASSGSTGVPKLIVHSQAGIADHSAAVAAAFGYSAADAVVLGQLPLCGVWGYTTALSALAGGAAIVLMERFEPAAAVDAIERYTITHANGPDVFLRQLFTEARRAPARISSLRAIGFSTFSNDALELVTEGDALGITLFQVYGSSEQQALMVRQPGEGLPAQRADAGGHPSNPATRIRVRDAATGEVLEPGVAGLLESSGPNVMLGYLTRDGIDTTSAFTDDGWLQTGDIGEVTDDGMRYLSRAKDVLRLSGFLVDPREIELHLESLPAVSEAKVVAIDTERGPRCVAFVQLAEACHFDEVALLERCRSDLASFKVPQRIFPIDDFPRIDGANGPRIQRLALRDMATERLSA